MILASWFKKAFARSFLGQVYVDQNKTLGIDVKDKQIKQKIYAQYLQAFQEGAYNYIKEDYDPYSDQVIARKYFSGGAGLFAIGDKLQTTASSPLVAQRRQQLQIDNIHEERVLLKEARASQDDASMFASSPVAQKQAMPNFKGQEGKINIKAMISILALSLASMIVLMLGPDLFKSVEDTNVHRLISLEKIVEHDVYEVTSMRDIRELSWILDPNNEQELAESKKYDLFKVFRTFLFIIDGRNPYPIEWKEAALFHFRQEATFDGRRYKYGMPQVYLDVLTDEQRQSLKENFVETFESVLAQYQGHPEYASMVGKIIYHAQEALAETDPRLFLANGSLMALLEELAFNPKVFGDSSVDIDLSQNAKIFLISLGREDIAKKIIDFYLNTEDVEHLTLFEFIKRLETALKIQGKFDQPDIKAKAVSFLASEHIFARLIKSFQEDGWREANSWAFQILMEFNGQKIIDHYFDINKIPILSQEDLDISLIITTYMNDAEITEGMVAQIVSFYQNLMKTYDVEDIKNIYRVYNTMSSVNVALLKDLDQQVVRILEEGAQALPPTLDQNNFYQFAKYYELYIRLKQMGGIHVTRVDQKFEAIKDQGFDESFIANLPIRNIEEYAFAVSFIDNLLEDRQLLDILYFRQDLEFIDFYDSEKVEETRLRINEISPALGDRLILNQSLFFVDQEFSTEKLTPGNFLRKINLAKSFSDPEFVFNQDIHGFYQLMGNFMLSRLSEYIEDNSEAIFDAIGEEAFKEELDWLIESGFYEEEDGKVKKLLDNLTNLNIGYIFHKATSRVQGFIGRDSLSVQEENYSIQQSTAYALEDGADILEMKQKGEEEVLAYIVKVDPNKGGRIELSSDVGRRLGGISGTSLSMEIGERGRLIVDFPVSFTTGNAKPTEIAIEDGRVENYLISVQGKDGFIIVYEDHTVHIADKRDLWIHDLDPNVSAENDKKLDITRKLEDYMTFIKLSQRNRISVVSNMLLYDGKVISLLKDGPDQRRLFIEFDDGTFGMINPMQNMSTDDAVKLAIVAGAKKVVYADTGQFDYTTFRPLSGDPIVWGHSDQNESSNRLGIYIEKSESETPPPQDIAKDPGSSSPVEDGVIAFGSPASRGSSVPSTMVTGVTGSLGTGDHVSSPIRASASSPVAQKQVLLDFRNKVGFTERKIVHMIAILSVVAMIAIGIWTGGSDDFTRAPPVNEGQPVATQPVQQESETGTATQEETKALMDGVNRTIEEVSKRFNLGTTRMVFNPISSPKLFAIVRETQNPWDIRILVQRIDERYGLGRGFEQFVDLTPGIEALYDLANQPEPNKTAKEGLEYLRQKYPKKVGRKIEKIEASRGLSQKESDQQKPKDQDTQYKGVPASPFGMLLPVSVPGEFSEQGKQQEQAQTQSISKITDGLQGLINITLPFGQTFQTYQFGPSVYHVEFNNLMTQGDAFDRIAFFVEVAGYRGRILTDEEMDNYYRETGQRVIFAGHDYRAESLASFYNEARRKGVKLRDIEEQFKAIFLRENIIREQDGQYVGQTQTAVITATQDVSATLRKFYVTHEYYHAHYMTNTALSEAVTQFWKDLGQQSPSLKRIIERIISSLDYDIVDTDLLIREFFSYFIDPTLTWVAYARHFTEPLNTEIFERIENERGVLKPDYIQTFRRLAQQLQAIADQHIVSKPESPSQEKENPQAETGRQSQQDKDEGRTLETLSREGRQAEDIYPVSSSGYYGQTDALSSPFPAMFGVEIYRFTEIHLKALLHQLNSEDVVVRENAAKFLDQGSYKEKYSPELVRTLVEQLISQLSPDSPENLRYHIVRALGKIVPFMNQSDKKEATKVILDSLEDSSDEFQEQAFRSLGLIGHFSAFNTLFEKFVQQLPVKTDPDKTDRLFMIYDPEKGFQEVDWTRAKSQLEVALIRILDAQRALPQSTLERILSTEDIPPYFLYLGFIAYLGNSSLSETVRDRYITRVAQTLDADSQNTSKVIATIRKVFQVYSQPVPGSKIKQANSKIAELEKKYQRRPQRIIKYLAIPEVTAALIKAQQQSEFDIDFLTAVAFGEGYNLFARAVMRGIESNRFDFIEQYPMGIDSFGSRVNHLKRKGYLRKDFDGYESREDSYRNEAGDVFPGIAFDDAASALEAVAAVLKDTRDRFKTEAEKLGYDVSVLDQDEWNAWTYVYYSTRNPQNILKAYGLRDKNGNSTIIGKYRSKSHGKDSRYTAQWPAGVAQMLRDLEIFKNLSESDTQPRQQAKKDAADIAEQGTPIDDIMEREFGKGSVVSRVSNFFENLRVPQKGDESEAAKSASSPVEASQSDPAMMGPWDKSGKRNESKSLVFGSRRITSEDEKKLEYIVSQESWQRLDVKEAARWFLPYAHLPVEELEQIVQKAFATSPYYQQGAFSLLIERNEFDTILESIKIFKKHNVLDIVITVFGPGINSITDNNELREIIPQIIHQFKGRDDINITMVVYDQSARSLAKERKLLDIFLEEIFDQYPQWQNRIKYEVYYGDIKNGNSANQKHWEAMLKESHITFWRHTWVGEEDEEDTGGKFLNYEDMLTFAGLLEKRIPLGALIINETLFDEPWSFNLSKLINKDTRANAGLASPAMSGHEEYFEAPDGAMLSKDRVFNPDLDQETSAQLSQRIAEDLGLSVVNPTVFDIQYGDTSYSRERWSRKDSLKKEYFFIRIANLFFLDPELYEELSADLKSKIESNVILMQDLHKSTLGHPHMGDHTTSTVVAMLQNDFTDFEVVNFGSGDGILNLVAARLGAKSHQLIDKDGEALKRAAINLPLNGLIPGADFELIEEDINNTEKMQRALLKSPNKKAVIGSIGQQVTGIPWRGYFATNIDVIKHFTVLSNVQLVIVSGYLTPKRMLGELDKLHGKDQNQLLEINPEFNIYPHVVYTAMRGGYDVGSSAWMATTTPAPIGGRGEGSEVGSSVSSKLPRQISSPVEASESDPAMVDFELGSIEHAERQRQRVHRDFSDEHLKEMTAEVDALPPYEEYIVEVGSETWMHLHIIEQDEWEKLQRRKPSMGFGNGFLVRLIPKRNSIFVGQLALAEGLPNDESKMHFVPVVSGKLRQIAQQYINRHLQGVQKALKEKPQYRLVRSENGLYQMVDKDDWNPDEGIKQLGVLYTQSVNSSEQITDEPVRPDEGARPPLLPLVFGESLEGKVPNSMTDDKSHKYPIYRLSKERAFVKKYQERSNYIDPKIFLARAAYVMAHMLDFNGVNTVQIYNHKEGFLSVLESVFGDPLALPKRSKLGIEPEVELEWELDVSVSNDRQRYYEFVQNLGESFVRGDIFRVFSNHYLDSFAPEHIRIKKDERQVRWVDYGFTFLRSGEKLSDKILKYLQDHHVFYLQYGYDLIEAIAEFDDSQIEYFVNEVYSKEAKAIMKTKLQETGAFESDQDFHEKWEDVKNQLKENVTSRRNIFKEFHQWLLDGHPDKVAQAIAGTYEIPNEAMSERDGDSEGTQGGGASSPVEESQSDEGMVGQPKFTHPSLPTHLEPVRRAQIAEIIRIEKALGLTQEGKSPAAHRRVLYNVGRGLDDFLYDLDMNEEDFVELLNDLREELFQHDILGLGEPLRVLEVGAGRGQFLREIQYIAREYFLPISFEFHGTNLALQNEASEIQFHHVDHLEKLPFQDGEFHLIVSQKTLQFASDPLATLEEIDRVLSPYGRALISGVPVSMDIFDNQTQEVALNSLFDRLRKFYPGSRLEIREGRREWIGDYDFHDHQWVEITKGSRKNRLIFPVELVDLWFSGGDSRLLNLFRRYRLTADLTSGEVTAENGRDFEDPQGGAASPVTQFGDDRGEENKAQGAADSELGGIDLTDFDIEIQRDSRGNIIPLAPHVIQSIQFDGLVPVIINIMPVHNLPLFLGYADEAQESEHAQTPVQYDLQANKEDEFENELASYRLN